MTFPPDRLEQLVARLAAGEPITRAEVHRIAALQALDLARAGRAFLEQTAAEEEALTERLRKTLESVP